MKKLSHQTAAVLISILSILNSARCLGDEMTPLTPAHAQLFEGRKLFINKEGVVYVQISPAPAVRLSDELLPLTFSFPTSNEEALEIAQFPHTGAVVQSEKVINDFVSMLENAGLTKQSPEDEYAGIDSFTFRKDYKGYEYGETVKKKNDGGFSVEFVALVKRPEDRMGILRVRRYSYNFEKGALKQMVCYSEYDLLTGPALHWQSMEGSPPPRVSHLTRDELVAKMFKKCGKVLPSGR